MMRDSGDSRPKVVRIIARLNVGGPARHVLLLNEGLERIGYDTLLVHGSVGEGEASLEQLASDSRLAVVKVAELGRRVHPLDDMRAFRTLLRLIFREKPDIVHTHTAKAGALGRLAALMFNLTRPRAQRIAIVHTFHGHVLTGYFSAPVNFVVRVVERGLASITDRIVTISPAQRRDIVERFGIASPARTTVIPLGLNLSPLVCLPQEATGWRSELGIGAQDLVIGYVGRFVPIKDLATLVRAFAIVLDKRPDAWLLLAGDGPTRPSVETLASDLGAARRVRFLGWTTDLPAVYATLDVCALSSLNEGTPVAIIEGMAAAKAVVATAVGGVADLVRDHETGLLVPAGEPTRLAEAIVRLGLDVDLRRRLGARAREEVASRFGRDRLAADVAALYAELVDERRGGGSSSPRSSQSFDRGAARRATHTTKS